MAAPVRGEVDDFESWLEEIEDHIDQLRKHHRTVRDRARGAIRDSYPTSSMPDSAIAKGRVGDPTGSYVCSIAGGKSDPHDPTRDTPDRWDPPRDYLSQQVRRMIAEAKDARNRLRGSVQAMRNVLPPAMQEESREQCVRCGVAKGVATKRGKRPAGWVVAQASCESCVLRSRRYGRGAS